MGESYLHLHPCAKTSAAYKSSVQVTLSTHLGDHHQLISLSHQLISSGFVMLNQLFKPSSGSTAVMNIHRLSTNYIAPENSTWTCQNPLLTDRLRPAPQSTTPLGVGAGHDEVEAIVVLIEPPAPTSSFHLTSGPSFRPIYDECAGPNRRFTASPTVT